LFLLLIFGVIYRNLKNDARAAPYGHVEPLELHLQVLQCNPEAFECGTAGNKVLDYRFFPSM
jgi:hypothetical protein